ncbi:MAG: ribonuclease Y [Candidatus Berkelbacteria bacterium]|nr:ribonuclease Y [Candidatus Berkelbacteria bacterium]
MSINLIVYLVLAATGGLGVGYGLRQTLLKKNVEEASKKAKEIVLEAKDEALKIKEEAKKEEKERRDYLEDIEHSLRRKEDNLENRFTSLEEKQKGIEARENELSLIKEKLISVRKEQEALLSKIAKISKDEARKSLLDLVEKEYKEEILRKMKDMEALTKEEADSKSRKILADVIQRIASEQATENTVSVVNLPSDEMKGRIIGREGRNIQIFEKETGVDVIIDDTPEVVTISAFDPIRREVARIALDKLVADGRIQPSRIEEQVEKAKEEVGRKMREAGEQAALEIGITGLPLDIVKILGRLKYRTSYGQNVLRHSVETAHIAGILAAELGADASIAKKAGLLHDLGKAVDQEIQGAHHHISRDILKKYGFPPEIIHAVEAHHDDIEAKTVEAVIVKASDAISSSRPGARRETLETYVKRLEELEGIANSFPGVDKSYAIAAGREVRIIVRPEDIDDLTAAKLARDIARKVEKEVQYPGQIKVNVIRETRAVEYAK